MPTLHELEMMDANVVELLIAAEGEETADIAAIMDALQLHLRPKVDGYVRMKETFIARVAALRGEAAWHTERAKQLTATADARENEAKRLWSRLADFMARTGRRVLEGDVFTVKFEGVGGKPGMVKLTERIEDVPERWIATTRAIDWKAVREAAEQGDAEALALVSFAPKGERLVAR